MEYLLAKQPWVAHGFLRKSNTFFSQGNVYTCHLTRFTTQYKPIYRVFIVSTVAILGMRMARKHLIRYGAYL